MDPKTGEKNGNVLYLLEMSNLIINIRILDWHFQVSANGKCAITNNKEHHSRSNYPHGLWCIYKLFNWL